MKVVILVKQVPLVTDLKFDPETKTLIREGVPNVINPYDRYAIVESVKLKKAHGGEAVAVTMGPPQAREAMVEALALGCDRAVHIVDRAFAGSDTLATARALESVSQKGRVRPRLLRQILGRCRNRPGWSRGCRVARHPADHRHHQAGGDRRRTPYQGHARHR